MENIKFGDHFVEIDVDEEIYSLEAIYGACHLFIQDSYVRLSRPASEGDRSVRIRLKAKEKASSREQLESLVGEFANELLNQVMRQVVGAQNAAVREQYLAKSFATGRQNPTVAHLLAELDAEELEEESLEIAVPWDESPKS